MAVIAPASAAVFVPTPEKKHFRYLTTQRFKMKLTNTASFRGQA
jgi:hypothetical protein